MSLKTEICTSLPVLHDTSYTCFRHAGLLPNYPVLWPPHLVDDWPIFKLWLDRSDSKYRSGNFEASAVNFGYLRAQYGSLQADVIHSKTNETKKMAVAEILDLWQIPERTGSTAEDRGRSLYLKDWHLPLLIAKAPTDYGLLGTDDLLYTVPDVCKDDWMNEYYGSDTEDDFRFIYMGGGDTITGLHKDVFSSYSISTNVRGAKLWTLFPPAMTDSLTPLIQEEERKNNGSGRVDVRTWNENTRLKFAEMGMIEVIQQEGETIFIPSGWFHQVENLSHPTFSINHNWCNSHNLPAMYHAMCEEVARVRSSICDVEDLLRRHEEQSEILSQNSSWKKEFEDCVANLLQLEAGWNWMTFWQMVLRSLQTHCELATPSKDPIRKSRWVEVPEHAQPPGSYVYSQLKPLVDDFLRREEAEAMYTNDLMTVLEKLQSQLCKLQTDL